MPSGNNTETPVDIRVTNPPPTTIEAGAKMMLAGAGGAAAGAIVAFLGYSFQSRPLAWLGLLLGVVGFGVALMGYRRLLPTTRSQSRLEVPTLPVGEKLGLAASDCVPLADGGVFHLKPKHWSPCPDPWPAGSTVTFHRSSDDVPLASVAVSDVHCTLELNEDPEKKLSPMGFFLKVT